MTSAGVPYAEVIGDPVTHSKSPSIHRFWLEKLDLEGDYRALHVPPTGLAAYLAERRSDSLWRGCNITMPHKTTVIEYLDELTPCSEVVGAVNCVIVHPEIGLVGHNSDLQGIRVLLKGLIQPGASVCLIGAGGAGRAVMQVLRESNILEVMIFARSLERAGWLNSEFDISGSGYTDPASAVAGADIIINASPLGMLGYEPMPATFIDYLMKNAEGDEIVFDMVYAPAETALLKAAASRGMPIIDGFSMLIAQAAASFEFFFGRPAPREHDAELRAMLTS